MEYLIIVLVFAMLGCLVAIFTVAVTEYQSHRGGYFSEWTIALIIGLAGVSLLLAGQIGVLSATTAMVRDQVQPGVETYDGLPGPMIGSRNSDVEE